MKRGFSLIELTITLAIIGVLGLGLWSAWVMGLQVTSEKRAEVGAAAIANEQIERLKTLPYESVGTQGGIPTGDIPQLQTITLNGIAYGVRSAIFFIDDPFDGTSPDDPIPTDYKRVRVEVSWSGKFGVAPVVLMTDIAPKGVETNEGGGTLTLSVADAAAAPVAGARITLQNASSSPPIDLALTTDTKGAITIPGAPASQEGYGVTITKDGYSSDGTIRAAVGTNPSPTQPPLSVFLGQTTKALFAIDRLATATIRTVDNRGSQGWWRSLWPYRKNITIENEGAIEASSGTPLSITLDHATLVTEGKSSANGNDVRVVFWNGTYFEELDRIATTPWNETEVRIWFATKRAVPKGEEDDGYAVYYGNRDADAPLASPSTIFPPPLGTDTVGLWRFDDGKGSAIARDASGYGHDGTLTSLDPQTAWVPGKFGGALSFNGGTIPLPHVRVAPTPVLANVDNVTIEAWIYPTRSASDQTIVSKIDNAKLIGTYHLYQYYKSICLFVWKNPNPYDGKGCGGSVVLDAWNHVAGTYDGRFIKIYVNGALVGTAEKPGILSKTQWVELDIGKYAYHNWDPYYGRIDTVAIHKSARADFAYGKPTELDASLSTERNYQQPSAIPNVPVTITGAKIIGNDDNGKPIPKFTTTRRSDGSGTITLTNLEWDIYTVAVDKASGYDVAATLPLLPLAVAPARTANLRLTLLPHRDATLLVTVKDKNGSLDGASVRLTSATPTYDKTIVSGESGQSFFSPLQNDTAYTLTATKPGYATVTTTVHTQGQTYEEVALAPL